MPLEAASAPSPGPSPVGVARPLGGDEFAAAMAACGPFESRPHIGVAVSGGRDSLALALLAAGWVGARGGRLTAFIVDHRLRPGSTAEARMVAALLAGVGIESEILPWIAAPPATGISEAARRARYALLAERCRALGILHLLLGHQRGDQAETVLLRLADGSGPEGLAGMAAVVERDTLRLLRPLLGVERPRLAATVAAAGLRWIDDPSNQRREFSRVVAREALDDARRDDLHALAARFATDRRSLDQRLAGLCVELVSVDRRGFATLAREAFLALPPSIARRLLSRLAATFGGRHYPARRAGLERAHGHLAAGRNAVAGGCRFVVRRSAILVCREAGAISGPVAVTSPGPMLWDYRYRIDPPAGPGSTAITALGEAGRRRMLAQGTESLREMPAPAAAALPALYRDGALAGLFLPGSPAQAAAIVAGLEGGRAASRPATVIFPAVFRPAQGLAAAPWGSDEVGTLVLPAGKPI